MPKLSLRHPPSITFCVAALCLAIVATPLSTKVAGVVWFALFGWGVYVGVRWRSVTGKADAQPAALPWLAGTTIALVLAVVESMWWSSPIDSFNAQMRLSLAAIGVALVGDRGLSLRPWRYQILFAVASACLVALVVIATHVTLDGPRARDQLPANALPWALAIAFGICLLGPVLLESKRRRLAFFRLAALVAGLVAIGLSQSRAAMVVFAWAALLVGWNLLRGIRVASRWRAWGAVGSVVAIAVVVGAWVHPDDPLRNRQAGHDMVLAAAEGNYNSSLGVRVYLWNLAIEGIQESPWIGIGGTERLRRIKTAGNGLPAQQYQGLVHVRSMGHVHNHYLHAALDGGLVGLASVLAVLAALVAAAWRLQRVDTVAATQMWGITLVHAAAGFTNVNFAHNYYVVTLATAVGLTLLCAARRLPTRPVPP